tara:strand:+ start:1082 stop:1216 length:135 start_codon:yes stop_codon:yes gene_type:complete
MKTCNICKKELDLKEYGKWRWSNDGLNPSCKKCVAKCFNKTKTK